MSSILAGVSVAEHAADAGDPAVNEDQVAAIKGLGRFTNDTYLDIKISENELLLNGLINSSFVSNKVGLLILDIV